MFVNNEMFQKKRPRTKGIFADLSVKKTAYNKDSPIFASRISKTMKIYIFIDSLQF